MKNLSDLIEIVVAEGPLEGAVIEMKSLRGFEDSVACLLEEEAEERQTAKNRPLAA